MRGDVGEAAGELAALRAALDRIQDSGLDWQGRDALRTARTRAASLARRLGVAGEGPLVDRERYMRLLELAGPEGAPELLQRLVEDLRQVERGLARALGAPGAAEVRAQTHVLVALAGAVGATALQRLAEALNGAAHRGAVGEMQRLGAITLEQIALLARFIESEEARGRSAA